MLVHLSLRRKCIARVHRQSCSRSKQGVQDYRKLFEIRGAGYPGRSHGNNDQLGISEELPTTLAHYSLVVHVPRIRRTSGTKPRVGGG